MWFTKKIEIHWTDSEIKNVLNIAEEIKEVTGRDACVAIRYYTYRDVKYSYTSLSKDFDAKDIISFKKKLLAYLRYVEDIRDL